MKPTRLGFYPSGVTPFIRIRGEFVAIQDACVTRTSPGQDTRLRLQPVVPGGTLDTLSLVYTLIPVINKL